MSKAKRRLVEWGIVIAIPVTLCLWLWLRVLTPPPAVNVAPAEENRAVHPAGFSIILPANTDAELMTEELDGVDQISMRHRRGRSRYVSIFYARRTREPPRRYDPQSLVNFKGASVPGWSGPSGEYYAWSVYLNRDGNWFEIGLYLPGPDLDPALMPPDRWRRYLETFRIEPLEVATQPAR